MRGNVFYLKVVTPGAVKADAAKIQGAIELVDWPSFAAGGELLFAKVFDVLHLVGEEGAKAIVFGLGTSWRAKMQSLPVTCAIKAQ